jgi:hypothetical protein
MPKSLMALIAALMIGLAMLSAVSSEAHADIRQETLR